jgi:hypothetical protein
LQDIARLRKACAFAFRLLSSAAVNVLIEQRANRSCQHITAEKSETAFRLLSLTSVALSIVR